MADTATHLVDRSAVVDSVLPDRCHGHPPAFRAGRRFSPADLTDILLTERARSSLLQGEGMRVLAKRFGGCTFASPSASDTRRRIELLLLLVGLGA